MKIWLCRNNFDGQYSMFDSACEVTEDSEYKIWCGNLNHFIGVSTMDNIKKYFGLKRHLRKGTKKLVTWKKPLGG